MRVLEKGHSYLLSLLDEVSFLDGLIPHVLTFVKRVGDKFPGNEAPAHAGTTT